MNFSKLTIDLEAGDGKEFRIDGMTMEEFTGKQGAYCFEPFFFVESVLDNGYYFIFVCNCRDAGCDGWFKGVKVHWESESVTWTIQDKHWKTKPLVIAFRKSEYLKESKRLLEQMKSQISFNEKHKSVNFHQDARTIDWWVKKLPEIENKVNEV